MKSKSGTAENPSYENPAAAAVEAALGKNVARGTLYRVLVTDADYKHSVALARYIKQDMRDVFIVGHSCNAARIAKHYHCFDEMITNEPLQKTLQKHDFDQVIPVGGRSVLEVAQMCPEMAVLPSPGQLLYAYDKKLTIELANRIGVPAPKTQALTAVQQLVEKDLSFPCVVKAAHEVASTKLVRYCMNVRDVREAVCSTLRAGDRLVGWRALCISESVNWAKMPCLTAVLDSECNLLQP